MNISSFLKDSKRLNILSCFLLSIGIIAYKLFFHELWKDEWQAWMVSRDMSWGEMFSFLHYEGHPALWYIYLKCISALPVDDALALQVAHSILVVLSFYIFWIRCSLPSIWKWMISLSYFFVFEYGVLNRGYVLVILCSLLFISTMSDRKTRWSALSIFLLCQTEVFGVIIASSLLLYTYLQKETWAKLNLWAYLTGVIVFVITVFPRGNSDDFSRAYNQQVLSIEVVGEAIQGNLANVFGTGLIADTAIAGVSWWGILLSLMVLVLLYIAFKSEKNILRAGSLGLFGFILFGILIFTGGIRQWGMVYLLFVLMLILYGTRKEWSMSTFLCVSALLVCPVIHGIKAVHMDIELPFTNAQEVGVFIRDKVPETVPVVVINKFETAPVGAYAGRPLYELPSGAKFTYFKWLEKVYIPTQHELELFAGYKNVGGIVLLTSKPIDNKRFPNAQLWKAFDKANFKRENYWLYSLARPR